MNDYTPTTDEVKHRNRHPHYGLGVAEMDARFDRWLAAHDAEVEARVIARTGSCWDEGPEQIGVDDCDRQRPLCELPSGHPGAHRMGRTEWMERDPYNQVKAERDEALAALARVTDDSMKERLAEIPLWWKKRMDDGYVSTGARTEREVAADVLTVIRAVAADEQEATDA